MFGDNLEGQTADRFKSTVHEQNGKPWYGVANATDIWQPVDGGYAATLKSSIHRLPDVSYVGHLIKV